MPIPIASHSVFFAAGTSSSPNKRKLDEIGDTIIVAQPRQRLRTEPESDEILLQRQLEQDMNDASDRLDSFTFVDPNAHLRAELPEVGSVSPGGDRASGRRLSSYLAHKQANEHSPFSTYIFLEELHEKGAGARRAILDLSTKAHNPNRKISKPSAEHLKSAGLMRRDGSVSDDVLRDVRAIVDVEDFSDKITLKFPKRNTPN